MTTLQTSSEIETDIEVCDICGGENGEHHEVRTFEPVYPGEPHVADIGTAVCPASVEVEEFYE